MPITWPSTTAATNNLDAGGDNPSLARADIKAALDLLNVILSGRGVPGGFPAMESDGSVPIGTNFSLGWSGSNPVITFDTGDSLTYNRTSNALEYRLGGTLTGSISFAAPTGVADGSVTLAKLATQAAFTMLINKTSGAASPTASAPGSSMAIDARGLYWKPNVVQAVKTDVATINSTTFADLSGLSAAITPSSSASKVLVRVCVNIGGNTAGATADFKLVRGTTDIGIGTGAGNRIRSTVAVASPYEQNSQACATFEFLDSPATTSATTYKVQWRSSVGDVKLNCAYNDADTTARSRTISTITLTEIPV